MYPSDFRDTGEDVRITLLTALCLSRQAEITDALVALVHKINARAERRVEKQLTAELKKVRGKEGILTKLATTAVDKPDESYAGPCSRWSGRRRVRRRHPAGNPHRRGHHSHRSGHLLRSRRRLQLITPVSQPAIPKVPQVASNVWAGSGETSLVASGSDHGA